MIIRKYSEKDIFQMMNIWNEIIEEGVSFPQEDFLNQENAKEFFDAQTYCGVACDGEKVLALYTLHPNNVGRCGHIANSSFAVSSCSRGQGIGEKIVADCLEKAKLYNFKIMQFNAVVASNVLAKKVYKKLGFNPLGTIPKGFKMKDGSFEDIELYYYEL